MKKCKQDALKDFCQNNMNKLISINIRASQLEALLYFMLFIIEVGKKVEPTLLDAVSMQIMIPNPQLLTLSIIATNDYEYNRTIKYNNQSPFTHKGNSVSKEGESSFVNMPNIFTEILNE